MPLDIANEYTRIEPISQSSYTQDISGSERAGNRIPANLQVGLNAGGIAITTATTDIIITGINWYFSASGTPVTIQSILINNVLFWRYGSASTGEDKGNFPIPNIYLRAGDTISFTALVLGGTSFQGGFIAYGYQP